MNSSEIMTLIKPQIQAYFDENAKEFSVEQTKKPANFDCEKVLKERLNISKEVFDMVFPIDILVYLRLCCVNKYYLALLLHETWSSDDMYTIQRFDEFREQHHVYIGEKFTELSDLFEYISTEDIELGVFQKMLVLTDEEKPETLMINPFFMSLDQMKYEEVRRALIEEKSINVVLIKKAPGNILGAILFLVNSVQLN